MNLIIQNKIELLDTEALCLLHQPKISKSDWNRIYEIRDQVEQLKKAAEKETENEL